MPSMHQKQTQGGVDFFERFFFLREVLNFFFFMFWECPLTYSQIDQQLAIKHHKASLCVCVYIYIYIYIYIYWSLTGLKKSWLLMLQWRCNDVVKTITYTIWKIIPPGESFTRAYPSALSPPLQHYPSAVSFSWWHFTRRRVSADRPFSYT
jgi:hypothetical protein